MATIGTFTKTSDGYTGTVRTLSLKLELIIKPSAKDNDKAPDHRVYADGIECGAGWTKRSAAGHDYISCKLDDPSLETARVWSILHGLPCWTFLSSRRLDRIAVPDCATTLILAVNNDLAGRRAVACSMETYLRVPAGGGWLPHY